MGVKYLWDVIDIIKTKETLDYMRGKVVSCDLSIWIVEAIKTLQFKTSVLKPHLRNLFFRLLALRRLGVKVIFVLDGTPPELKQETMRRRAFLQYGVKINAKKKMGRGRFERLVQECVKLFEMLGIPYIRAEGEAEAMCAALNSSGLTDGCLTNDSDVFLYGARVVYRDFGIDPKDPHMFVYKMSDIESRVKLSRKDLVGLAMLAGCDYTSGIYGIGKKSINNFLNEKTFEEDLLTRMKKWFNKDRFPSDITKTEAIIIKKAVNVDNVYNEKIADEYLVNRNDLANMNKVLKFGYPDVKAIQDFLLEKLEWPEEYTLPKVLQLATSTYLEKLSDGTFFPVPIKPDSIVKTRAQQGVALVEVRWCKYDDGKSTYSKKWTNCPEDFVTLENQQVVMKVLPSLVEAFLRQKEEKKKKKTKKTAASKKKEPNLQSPNACENEFEETKKTAASKKKEPNLQSPNACENEFEGTIIDHEPRKDNGSNSELADFTEQFTFMKTDSVCNGKDDLSKQETCSESSDDEFIPLSQRIQTKMKLKYESGNTTVQDFAKHRIPSEVFSKRISDDRASGFQTSPLDKSIRSDSNFKLVSTKSNAELSECTPKIESVFFKVVADSANISKVSELQMDNKKSNLDSKNDQECDGKSILGECFALTKDDNRNGEENIHNTQKSIHQNGELKDITNFSYLGDSILCDSFENLNISNTMSPCVVRLNKNSESISSVKYLSKAITNGCKETDDKENDGRNNEILSQFETVTTPSGSPMCLADRLKLKR